MVQKIVLVTAGGHISPFHAAMKRMCETLERRAPGRFELVGAKGGLSGLAKGDFVPIPYGVLEEDRAGSLIGADRTITDTDRILTVARSNGLYAVVMMGGDNHLGEAARLFEHGVNVVGYPKTMDGDLNSGVTLGYETAVTVGAMQTRYHHTAAITNGRVFFVGLFGRNTDWVVCAVSLYGGADRAIPAERKYSWDYIRAKINASLKENEQRYGKKFAVITFSEGAVITGEGIKCVRILPHLHYSEDGHKQPKLHPEWIGMELVRLARFEGLSAYFEAHTYSMRDSPPTETDKVLSRMAGEECINMILDGDFGKSAVFEPDGSGFFRAGRAPLIEVAKQRRLEPTGFFDYAELRSNPSFHAAYGDLFKASLGDPPKKDQLVYRNMLKSDWPVDR